MTGKFEYFSPRSTESGGRAKSIHIGIIDTTKHLSSMDILFFYKFYHEGYCRLLLYDIFGDHQKVLGKDIIREASANNLCPRPFLMRLIMDSVICDRFINDQRFSITVFEVIVNK